MLQRFRHSRRAALLWVACFALAWIVLARPPMPQLLPADVICSAGGAYVADGAAHDDAGMQHGNVHCKLCTLSAALLPPDLALPPALPAQSEMAPRSLVPERIVLSGPPAPARGPPAGIRLRT